jgi:hypothetical protein
MQIVGSAVRYPRSFLDCYRGPIETACAWQESVGDDGMRFAASYAAWRAGKSADSV